MARLLGQKQTLGKSLPKLAMLICITCFDHYKILWNTELDTYEVGHLGPNQFNNVGMGKTRDRPGSMSTDNVLECLTSFSDQHVL